MAETIKLKRSAVQGKVPTTGDLELGELALNTYDGKLYTLKDDGSASIVEIGGSGVTDGDKGDITVSNSGATWKIDHGSARQLLQTNAGATAVEWTNDVEIPGVLGIQTGSEGSPSLYFAGDSDTGIYSPAANELAITTGGTRRYYFSSIGELKLYRDATSKAIGSITIGTAASNESIFSIGVSTSLDAAFLTSSQNGSGLVRPIVFGVGGSSEERLRIDTSGRVLIGTTNATSSGAKLQTVDGITFPATQAASSNANTLDDYEEGTFTPYIIGMTVTGTGTYTFQNGFYTKIGNQVIFQLSLGWSAHTGSGVMRLDGLPFTTMSNTEQTCSMISNGMSSAANTVVRAIIDNNTTQIRFFNQLISTGTYTATNLDTSVATVFISGVYRI